MTRQDILKELNHLTLKYNLTWDDVKVDADKAIHQINTALGCYYPDITTVLVNDTATYTYRDHLGDDVPIIKDVYFHTIIFPYMAMEILARDEEFTTVYQKYQQEFERGKFEILSNEFGYVPDRYKRPRNVEGVFFPSANKVAGRYVTTAPSPSGATATPSQGVTRKDILKELNRLTLRHNLTWNDVKVGADKAVHQVNTVLSCNFPGISSVLINDEATYTYKDQRGVSIPIIKDTYFHSVIFPYMAMEILARDEEFTTVYQKYQQEFTKGKFEMFSNELNYVPERFKRPRAEGMFFQAGNQSGSPRVSSPAVGYASVTTPSDAGGGTAESLPNRTQTMIAELKTLTASLERRLSELEGDPELFTFDTQTEFPVVGEENKLYLARFRYIETGSGEQQLEDYNMLFRYDTLNNMYVAVAGSEAGSIIVRSLEEPVDAPEGTIWYKPFEIIDN